MLASVLIVYLIFAVLMGQLYKIITSKMKNPGALTVLVNFLSGTICLLFIPLFEIKFASDIWSYVFLSLACIFYALNDRLSTTVRKGVEASTFSILKQTKTVFMILAGLIFFKDPLVWNKIVGAFLIVIGNIIVFYKKGELKTNKYFWLGLLASVCMTIALLIDVNYSDSFNLPMYISFTTLVPAIMIFIFDKLKVKDIIQEYKNANKWQLFVCATSMAIMMTASLYAYQIGNASVVAPLCSLTIILNVIVGYIFLKEKSRLPQKIIGAILIILSVVLIKL